MKTIPIKSMSELVPNQKYSISVKEKESEWEGIATFSHLIKDGGYDEEVGLFTCDEDGEDGVFSLDEIVGKIVDDTSADDKSIFTKDQLALFAGDPKFSLLLEAISLTVHEHVHDERIRCIQAVNDEEELEGEMPDSLWAELRLSKEKATEVCRKIVRLTKESIINRIN